MIGLFVFLLALVLMLAASAMIVEKQEGSECCESVLGLACASVALFGVIILTAFYMKGYFGFNMKTGIYFAFIAVLLAFGAHVIMCKEEGKMIDKTMF